MYPQRLHKLLGKKRVSGIITVDPFTYDDFEAYGNGAQVAGLNGGNNGTYPWLSSYVARPGLTSLQQWDDFEGYTDLDLVDGLNGGSAGLGSWLAPYVAHQNYMNIEAQDTMESYTDGATVDGLNGGENILGSWQSAYRGFGTSVVIKARTIQGLSDKVIQMSGGDFARKVTLPGGWSKIRVGIRLQANNGAGVNDHTAFLAFGLCSGTTNVFGDASTQNFAGLYLKDGIDYNGPANNWVFQVYAATKVGTTVTNTSSFSGTGTFGKSADVPTADRTVMFVDITKGSPNYSFEVFVNTSNASPSDLANSDFITIVQETSPTSAGCSYIGPKTLAVDEATNGTFDAINVHWPSTVTNMEIYDLAVVQLA